MEQSKTYRISEFLGNQYVNLIMRLFIGLTFIISAASKLPHHVEFEAVVTEYEILPDALATAYANALPWVELFVGVYLIAGVLIRPGAILTLLMGISFMAANIKSLSQGEEFCGDCFGEVWSMPVEQAIIIDVFLIAASIILLISRPNSTRFSLNRLRNQISAENPEKAQDPQDAM